MWYGARVGRIARRRLESTGSTLTLSHLDKPSPAVPSPPSTALHDQLDGAFVPGGESLAAAGAMPPKEGKLFVGGISWETVESTIYEHFSAFGELADCVLMTNKVGGCYVAAGAMGAVAVSAVDTTPTLIFSKL